MTQISNLPPINAANTQTGNYVLPIVDISNNPGNTGITRQIGLNELVNLARGPVGATGPMGPAGPAGGYSGLSGYSGVGEKLL